MKILVIGMSHSIHTARWIQQFEGLGHEFHLYPNMDRGATHAVLQFGTVHHTFYAKQDNLGNNLKFTGFLVSNPKFAAWLRDLVGKYFPNYRLKKLAKLIDKIQPDIIHSMGIHSAGDFTLQAKKLTKKKFPAWLVSNWGSDLFFFGQLSRYCPQVKEVLAQAGHYSCENKRDQDLALEFGFNGVVHPYIQAGGGWDLKKLQPIREKIAPSKRKLILIKGYQNMLGRAAIALRALERCKDLLTDYEVMLFTPVPAEEVTDLVEWFSIRTGIKATALPRTGNQMTILELQAKSRIFIGLSVSDGVSNSFLEAMIMGAFPIQSHPSNTHEWIKDGVTGISVEAEDSDDVEKALRRALTDDQLVDNAAKLNWQVAQNRLTDNKIRQQAIDMYQNILSGD